MAAIKLLTLALAVHGTFAVDFTVCGFVYRDGVCREGGCPSGTVQQSDTFFNYAACQTGFKCCTGTPTATCENEGNCGVWGATARLAFSKDDKPKQAPWQASLRRMNGQNLPKTLANSLHNAGGVLIQKNWVLSDCAAVMSVGRRDTDETYQDRMIVVLGDYNISIPEVYNNVPQEQVRQVKNVYFHPSFKYNTTSTFNDVLVDYSNTNAQEPFQANAFCMIELTEPVEYNDWVRPICLPKPDICSESQSCRVTGWGITEDETLKDVLQVAYLTSFSKPACEAIDYYSTGNNASLPSNTKCAQNVASTYACVGDFGGPFACDDSANNYRTTLQGVMTTRIPCQGSTTLVSDVPLVVNWVWQTCTNAL
ncbi:phenoloxidase-activating factor 3-like [Haliotis rufescens]|uniref:phenoloxidase-activating factor 3-like n=1 Tax=Haliotis rufescens TaxID=6454 RepID=UPI001EB09A15|nr:phenoloxidase-activating factor 3-like [Haliotis rufescens]